LPQFRTVAITVPSAVRGHRHRAFASVSISNNLLASRSIPGVQEEARTIHNQAQSTFDAALAC
jgi:hypothetical protein